MEGLLLWVGRLAGLAGIAICAWAVISRLTGGYYVASFQIGTLLLGGMAALLVACFCFLLVLMARTQK